MPFADSGRGVSRVLEHIGYRITLRSYDHSGLSLAAQLVKNPPAFLGREDPLEKG